MYSSIQRISSSIILIHPWDAGLPIVPSIIVSVLGNMLPVPFIFLFGRKLLELQNKPLSESGLKTEHNIMVMLVEHPGRQAEPANARTVFQPGDKLTVFGNYAVIGQVFHARERFSEQ